MDNTRALTDIFQNVMGDITVEQMRCLLDAVSSLDGMIGGIWEKHGKLLSPTDCGDEYQRGWRDGCSIGITLVTLLWQKRN